MFHPDAFNGTSKKFQDYVLLTGKLGLFALLCILISIISVYVFPDSYDGKKAFNYYDLVAYAVAFAPLAVAFVLVLKITRIARPNAYDSKS